MNNLNKEVTDDQILEICILVQEKKLLNAVHVFREYFWGGDIMVTTKNILGLYVKHIGIDEHSKRLSEMLKIKIKS